MSDSIKKWALQYEDDENSLLFFPTRALMRKSYKMFKKCHFMNMTKYRVSYRKFSNGSIAMIMTEYKK